MAWQLTLKNGMEVKAISRQHNIFLYFATTLTCILQGSRYLASQGDLRKAIVGVCKQYKPRRIAGHIEPPEG
jgi:hypothetical protein